MILALGSLGLVAALNWQPLTLLLDTLLHWPNISMGLSQVALIACAAGSCVMITTVASPRKPATLRRIAMWQYGVAVVIAIASMVAFFAAGQQPEMSPEEYLRRNLGSGGTSLSWLLPLLYVLLALTLVSWAGMRHSNRTRRGRALFVFTVGIVLIVLASAFFFLRAVGTTQFVGVGAAATLLGCAMLVVAAGLAAAQRRRLVRRAPRAADHSAAARRTRPSTSRRGNRRAPAWAAGVPGGRADVADLRRAVPRGDAAEPRDGTRRCHRGVRGRRPGTSTADWPTSTRPSWRPRNRRTRSRSGSMRAAANRTRQPGAPRSLAWAGCVSRRRTRTGSGFWPSRSSTGSWTAPQPPWR